MSYTIIDDVVPMQRPDTSKTLDELLADWVAPCPDCPRTTIVISLTVAEQRKLVEHETQGPCVRIWITELEAQAIIGKDWTVHALPAESPHSFAMWRTRADLDKLQVTDISSWCQIVGRILQDHE